MARSSERLSRSSAKKLTGASFGGLSKGRMASGAGFSKRLRFDKNKVSTIMFWGEPDDPEAFSEYYVHSFKEDGNWKFVPCAGDHCPLDTDEEADKRKKRYRFAAQVFDMDTREPMIMEGPKDLAQRIYSKYEKLVEKDKARLFTRKVWEVGQLPTTPISYEVDVSDDKRVDLSEQEPPSIQEYIDGEINRYHGDIRPKRSSLQADDDEDERPRKKKSSLGTKKKKSTRDEPSSRRSSSSARSSSTRRTGR
jgi:hypothetical protein